jgi:hypothetical protein
MEFWSDRSVEVHSHGVSDASSNPMLMTLRMTFLADTVMVVR